MTGNIVKARLDKKRIPSRNERRACDTTMIRDSFAFLDHQLTNDKEVNVFLNASSRYQAGTFDVRSKNVNGRRCPECTRHILEQLS